MEEVLTIVRIVRNKESFYKLFVEAFSDIIIFMKQGGKMREKQELGKIISKARKEKKITQQEFANMLNVTDKAVSNWETGKNYPDLVILNDICEILDLNIEKLLIDSKKSRNFIKNVLTLISFSLVSILLIFLFLYFINNYNNFNVYEVIIENDKYDLNNSFLVLSNDTILLDLGNMNFKGNDNISQLYVKLFQKVDGEKKDLIAKNKYNGMTFYGNINEIEVFKNGELNDLYLEIDYKNESNELVQDYVKLIVKENTNNSISTLYYNDTNDICDKGQLILLKNNGYVKSENGNYVKYKVEDSSEIYFTYNISNYSFDLEKKKENLEYVFNYNPEKNLIEFKLLKENGSIIENFNYNIKSEEVNCFVGKCNNLDLYINEVLDEYKKINSV